MRGAPPLRCAVGYATALHDITHIVLSYSRDDDRVAGRALQANLPGCRRRPSPYRQAQRDVEVLSCREPLGQRSRPCGLRVALASAFQGIRLKSDQQRPLLICNIALQTSREVSLFCTVWPNQGIEWARVWQAKRCVSSMSHHALFRFCMLNPLQDCFDSPFKTIDERGISPCLIAKLAPNRPRIVGGVRLRSGTC